MKQLRIMSVAFDTEIAPYETPAFRGAVIEKVGLDRDFYHNHDNDPNSEKDFHYRYPLVQYKRQRRKPSIVFIEQGIDEAQHFFTQPDWNLTFAGKEYKTTISNLQVKQFPLGVTDTDHYYTLRRWMALNQENYRRFMALESLSDRIAFLERILAGHILWFARGVGHRFERRFDLSITEVLQQKAIRFEGVKVLTFDIRFKANLQLPAYIGLGKGVSQGYGVISRFNPRQQQES